MMCAAKDLMKCSADNKIGEPRRVGPNWKFSPLSECTRRGIRFIDPPTLESNVPYWIVFLMVGSTRSFEREILRAEVRVGAEIVIPEKNPPT